MSCLGQGGEGVELRRVTRRLLGAFGAPVGGPPQVKHPVAGGLAVEGGRRSPEAGDGGGTGLVGGSAGVPVERGVVVICV